MYVTHVVREDLCMDKDGKGITEEKTPEIVLNESYYKFKGS